MTNMSDDQNDDQHDDQHDDQPDDQHDDQPDDRRGEVRDDPSRFAAGMTSDGNQDEALFGISFDDVLRAQEFLIALTRMSAAGQLALRDAVVVVKGDDGKVHVRETVDPQAGSSALSGAVWTGLLGLFLGGPVGWLAGMGLGAGAGALVAKFVDVGIPDEWVEWFKSAVQPDTATVVALAADIDLSALYREAGRFSGAELVHTTLRPGASAHLAAALELTGRRASAPVNP